jgi:ABC-2 type transport system permease protein
MRVPQGLRPGFSLVFRRELRWLRRRPFLLALTTILPLTLMALLTTVFNSGLPTELPIGVLDLDGSTLSRAIIRSVDATPDVAVAERVGDLSEGRRLILSGKIHGLVMLPLNLERNVFAGRRPEVVFFYNAQTMTSGNLVLRGINNAVPGVVGGIRLAVRTAAGEPIEMAQADLVPVPLQLHPLFNPTLNYVHFLLAALLPSVLQIVVVTTAAYSVGVDFETPHRFKVLRRLGGGLWPAIAGKTLPYTVLFLMVLALVDGFLFSYLGLPLRGESWLLVLAALLFIVACQFIGALLALFLRSASAAIGLGTLLTAPAFGYMGIGFPRLGMGVFAYAWGALLPGTWYLQARIDQTVRGTPLDLSWQPVLVLAAFVVALGGLTALRAENLRAERVARERTTAFREATP